MEDTSTSLTRDALPPLTQDALPSLTQQPQQFPDCCLSISIPLVQEIIKRLPASPALVLSVSGHCPFLRPTELASLHQRTTYHGRTSKGNDVLSRSQPSRHFPSPHLPFPSTCSSHVSPLPHFLCTWKSMSSDLGSRKAWSRAAPRSLFALHQADLVTPSADHR